MYHAMLDLETWGQSPGCVIRSAGVVMFDPLGQSLGSCFYENFQEPNRPEFFKDLSTVEWWKKQDQKAQDVFNSPLAIPPEIAIYNLINFLKMASVKYIWSHGASFDIPIIEYYFKQYGFKSPYDFWNIRDTRTVYDIAGVKSEFLPGQIKHFALDDAKAQATAIQKGFRRITVSKVD